MSRTRGWCYAGGPLTFPLTFPLLSSQLKQKLHQSQQRATLCCRAADEAHESRGEAEKSRALAEARALGCQRDRDSAEADRERLAEELKQLRKEVLNSSDGPSCSYIKCNIF